MLSPENVRAPKIDLNPVVNSKTCNNIDSCIVPESMPSSSHFKVRVILKGQNRSTSVAAMVDCGATALFISKQFVKNNKVRTHRLLRELPLFNIDGSKNCVGGITHFARLRLRVGDIEEWHQFLVTELGPEDVVLGLPWLRSMNPEIDWAEGKMKVDTGKREEGNPRVEQVAANRVQRCRWWRTKILNDPSERLWCAAGYTYSAELAEKAGRDKRRRSFEEIVPREY
jgi:hypothetical protein